MPNSPGKIVIINNLFTGKTGCFNIPCEERSECAQSYPNKKLLKDE